MVLLLFNYYSKTIFILCDHIYKIKYLISNISEYSILINHEQESTTIN